MPADTVAVARDVLQHINMWADKPARFTLEDLQNKSPSLMLQPLAGSGVVRKYIDGSFIGLFSFAVYLRIATTDTHAKLSAYNTLESLAFWLENNPLPTLSGNRIALSIEQTATTTLAAVDEGVEDYQTIFSLNYKQS